jgi:acetyl esterase/lipase
VSERVILWRGKGARPLGSIGGQYLYAGVSGVGDTPGPHVVETFEHLQSRAYLTYAQNWRAQHTPAIELSHYALAVVPGANVCNVRWKFPPTTAWSFRLNMRLGGVLADGDFAVGTRPVIYGYGNNDSTLLWQMDCLKDDLVIAFPQNYFTGRKTRITAPNPTRSTAWSTYQIGGNRAGAQNPSVNRTVRIEGRCTSDGMLTLMLFEEAVSPTVPRSTHQIQLSDTPGWNMDCLTVGVRPASSVLCPIMQWDDVEIWDDSVDPDPWPRGQHIEPPSNFEEVVAPGVAQPLTLAGTLNTAGSLAPVNFWLFNDEFILPATINDHDMIYHSSSVDGPHYRLDLYRPNSTSGFSGPHPLIVWAHSGFFRHGSRKAIISSWVAKICAAGFAVASVQYPLVYSSEAFGTIKHPTQIRHFKAAIRWLQQNAATYNLDPTKVFSSGYSAGGFIALGANLTRGVTNAPGGYNLTLNYAPFNFSTDPTVIGTYVYAAPVNWTRMIAEDSTGFVILQTAEDYMGQRNPHNAHFSSMPQYVTPQAAPIAYMHATQDPLILEGNQNDLRDACLANGVPFSKYLAVAHHDNVDDIDDPEDPDQGIIQWATSILGGSPP